jgi:hypothetical protein
MSTNWKKIEQKAIEKLGGKSTPASGARPGQKADGHINFEWRVEHKGTDKDEFRINKSLLRKLESDCQESGGTPLLQISFRKYKRRLLVFPEYCLPDTEGLEHFEFPFYAEPYDHNLIFCVEEDEYWILLSEDVAKVRLGLEES